METNMWKVEHYDGTQGSYDTLNPGECCDDYCELAHDSRGCHEQLEYSAELTDDKSCLCATR
jgi:hypothetical protein